MDWLEAFKVIGSAAGIITGAFLLYDRIVRNRPTVYLRPGKYRAEVAVTNIASETILIEDVRVSPQLLQAAPGNDLRSTITAAAASVYPNLAGDNRVFVVVDPLATRSLDLVILDDFEKAQDRDRVRIRCNGGIPDGRCCGRILIFLQPSEI
jgi:hypothetical protein